MRVTDNNRMNDPFATRSMRADHKSRHEDPCKLKMDRFTRQSRTATRTEAIHGAMKCARACGLLVGFCVLLVQGVVVGQVRFQRQAEVVPAAPPVQVIQGVIDDTEPFGGGPIQGVDSGGATLKTDPDLEQLLETAERFRADGNYRAAARFWQAVLERSGDAMYSDDDRLYYSLAQKVEQILAELPPEGLQAYRITADANARELLAAAPDPFDVATLNKIVRQYFISSLGDQAALTLASISLDRFDFVGAYRLLNKIVSRHPDPDVDRVDVYLKMALCEAWLGDRDAVVRSLDRARELGGDSAERMADLILARLDRPVATKTETAIDPWRMELRNHRRHGAMPAVDEKRLADAMVADWQYYFDPAASYSWADFEEIQTLDRSAAVDGSARQTMTAGEEQLVKDWREKNWQPTGMLLFEGGVMVVKTPVDMIAWNLRAETPELAWRPVWRNAFEIDDFTKLVIMYQNNGNLRRRMPNLAPLDTPFGTNEIQLFGDRVAADMSIVDGIVYTIEGQRFDDRLRNRPPRQISHWNAIARRSRSNFLTAYDAQSGAVLWRLPDQEPETTENAEPAIPDPNSEVAESPFLKMGGFMGAPIGYRDLILVPVNQGGAISVYALDPSQNGRTVWKSFLCDEPETGAEAWAPIHLSLDGSDLLVSCGLGVVFVLDPATGMIRFAKRYARSGQDFELLRRFGNNMQQLQFDGWSSDVIVPWGSQMICFCSDTQAIEAISRIDGHLIWRSEINPLNYKVDYLLGIYDDILYAAGRETIIGYDLRGEGRMVLGGEPLFGGEKSLGRGMLTPQGIFMPVGNDIVQLEIGGKSSRPTTIRKIRVESGTGAPVGNLFSDGNSIWVHGANRVYRLAPLPKGENDVQRDKGDSTP